MCPTPSPTQIYNLEGLPTRGIPRKVLLLVELLYLESSTRYAVGLVPHQLALRPESAILVLVHHEHMDIAENSRRVAGGLKSNYLQNDNIAVTCVPARRFSQKIYNGCPVAPQPSRLSSLEKVRPHCDVGGFPGKAGTQRTVCTVLFCTVVVPISRTLYLQFYTFVYSFLHRNLGRFFLLNNLSLCSSFYDIRDFLLSLRHH